MCVFFFFKQKTAYEMRISDWSSDVCSSDLSPPAPEPAARRLSHGSSCIRHKPALAACIYGFRGHDASQQQCVIQGVSPDRKSVVLGKSVSVRVDLGGSRIIIKKKISKFDSIFSQPLTVPP